MFFLNVNRVPLKQWTFLIIQTRSHKVANIMKMLNYKLTVDEQKVEALVHTDGLQYADYDLKTSYPKASSVLTLAQSTAIYAHYTPLDTSGRSYREYTSAMAGRMPFTLTARMDFCKTFYDHTVPKNPMYVMIRGGDIGNSSNSVTATMYTNCGRKLVTNAMLLVAIDTETSKPAPLPDWWKMKYSKSASEHATLSFKRMSLPNDPLKFETRVLGRDLDYHGHTNWVYYMQFADDAIYHFALRDTFKTLKGFPFKMLKSLELMYGGETFEGDYLNTFVWEVEDEVGVVYVQIFKQSTFMFQGRFQYFIE